jgi:CO/xanthine dehydrogenase FAD-binding subunit
MAAAAAPTRGSRSASRARSGTDPIDDLRGSAEYKRAMARVWTERALREVA